MGGPTSSVDGARSFLARGDVDGAVAELTRSLDAADSPAARRLLGGLAYLDDRFDDARREWESAFAALRAAGEPRAAARVATDLAELHANTLGNTAAGNGWAARARRILDQVGPCVEWGYLELAFMACERPDAEDLLRSAERALLIATEYGDVDLEVRALADSGLALVTQGHVQDGFDRLDAALAAVSAGEIGDLSVVGKAFCSLLSSCDRVGDVRRAEEWTRLVQESILDRFDGRPRVLYGHCRAAYGSVLCSAGRWTEAEAALLEVLGPHGTASVGHRGDTLANLAALRVEQGRLEDAADLLAPYGDRLAACAPAARMHLVRGEADIAAAVVRRGLRLLVGDALRAGGLLALLVEAEVGRGETAAARDAADRLLALADAADSEVLAAEAALADGRVRAAAGEYGAAIAAFDTARHHLRHDERPLLDAIVSLELALTLAAAGRGPDAVAEARAALAVFERLGAAFSRDRTLALLRRLGVAARPGRVGRGGQVGRVGPGQGPGADGTRPGRGSGPALAAVVAALTARETEVLELVRRGASNIDIGTRLHISPRTAEHHVGRIFAKLGVRNRAEAAAFAAAAVPAGEPGRGRERPL